MNHKIAALCASVPLWFLLSGCKTSPPKSKTENRKPKIEIWGERGTSAGKFFEPRCVAIAPDGFVYIIDSTGRIQKWTKDGKFIKAWLAPSIENGRPEGVGVLKDGNIAITDTHYSKIRIYTTDGKLLRSFGSYGMKPGQFLLVTGICIDSDGFIYAADYGGDFDRVSKWTSAGKLIASWPGHGEGPRQFRRPCGLAISQSGELLVADIGNHRIQRLDRKTGKYLGEFGGRGKEKGQLNYPYGVAVDPKGFIYTVEYGAHRVQKWSPDGKFLQSWGGPGRAPGQLANPWGLAVDDEQNVYVADTQNHRIQKFRFPPQSSVK